MSSRNPAGAGDGSEEEDDVGDDCDDGDNDFSGVSVCVCGGENLPVALAHLGPDVGAKPSQGSRDADHSAQNHKSEVSHPQDFPVSSHLKSWALNEICWNSSEQICS